MDRVKRRMTHANGPTILSLSLPALVAFPSSITSNFDFPLPKLISSVWTIRGRRTNSATKMKLRKLSYQDIENIYAPMKAFAGRVSRHTAPISCILATHFPYESETWKRTTILARYAARGTCTTKRVSPCESSLTRIDCQDRSGISASDVYFHNHEKETNGLGREKSIASGTRQAEDVNN